MGNNTKNTGGSSTTGSSDSPVVLDFGDGEQLETTRGEIEELRRKNAEREVNYLLRNISDDVATAKDRLNDVGVFYVPTEKAVKEDERLISNLENAADNLKQELEQINLDKLINTNIPSHINMGLDSDSVIEVSSDTILNETKSYKKYQEALEEVNNQRQRKINSVTPYGVITY